MKLLNWFKKTYQQYKDSYHYFDLSHLTIEDLRKNNYTCQVFHSRFSLEGYTKAKEQKHQSRIWNFLTDKKNCAPRDFYSKGGKTEVFIQTPDFKKFKSVAYCSLEDNFCKKTGITIALKRLEQDYSLEFKDSITECCGQNCGCH